jgi:cell division protein FtsI/penicillin-binding protein 2
MAGVVATIGNDGVRPDIHILMDRERGCAGNLAPELSPVIPAEIAATMRAYWPMWGDVIGHLGSALSGPNRELSWFLGLDAKDAGPYGVVVLLENPASQDMAAHIGTEILHQVTAR